jgi:hypothetical protein
LPSALLGLRLLRRCQRAAEVVGDAVIEAADGGRRASAQAREYAGDRASKPRWLRRLRCSYLTGEPVVLQFSLSVAHDLERIKCPGMHGVVSDP